MKPIKVKAEVLEAEASEDAVVVEAEVIESKRAMKLLEASYDEAEKVIKSKDKIEELLVKMEKKLAEIPVAGENLAKLPLFASMVRSVVAGEFSVPVGTMLAAVGAIIYFVNPFDLAPDFFGAVGFADDAAVVAAAAVLINSDLVEYVEWRKVNKAEN